ncbi:type II toxin-antitoxin system prevent-host-death family antitoxin [uncultured Parolsenella sp.]|uniref:type II toxin-antitoxin system Phd/YefM family antitoxin n=1 Tax=uncultured Parolsenella sp. TaxID=2083008 RepID=UPI0027D945B3|nr:type II toxin-antitoxin system prevent-host-death family antitoxin [uncultured Parolsenella sp.]
MTTVTFTEARQNLRHYCDKAVEDAAPVVITRTGRENVVLLSQDEWDSVEETLYVMSSPGVMEGLRESQAEAEAGDAHEWGDLAEFRAAMRERAARDA